MARKTPSKIRAAERAERPRRRAFHTSARCVNGRCRYDERHAALQGLRSARLQAGRAVRAGLVTARQERGVCRCDVCGGWHLTVAPSAPERRAVVVVLPTRVSSVAA